LATFAFDSLQAVIFSMPTLIAQNVKFSPPQVKLEFALFVTSALSERLVEAIECFLKVFLLIFARSQEEFVQLVICVFFEVFLHLFRGALESHRLQSLEFRSFKHFRSDFLAV
jgi:hypothetical protein